MMVVIVVIILTIIIIIIVVIVVIIIIVRFKLDKTGHDAAVAISQGAHGGVLRGRRLVSTQGEEASMAGETELCLS